MPIVPKKLPEMITFYQQRVTQWTDNAASIGLSAPEMATMATRVSAAADFRAAGTGRPHAGPAFGQVLPPVGHGPALGQGLHGGLDAVEIGRGRTGGGALAERALFGP